MKTTQQEEYRRKEGMDERCARALVSQQAQGQADTCRGCGRLSPRKAIATRAGGMFSFSLMGCSTSIADVLSYLRFGFSFRACQAVPMFTPAAAAVLFSEVEAVACRFGDLIWNQQGVPPPDFSATRQDWSKRAALPCRLLPTTQNAGH